MIKSIIFDFDGVIAESVHVKTKAFSLIYSPYGKDVKNKVVAHHLANGGVSRIEKFKLYHKSFLNLKLNNNDLIILDKRFSIYVLNKVVNSSEIEGANEFLKKYYKKKKLFINSLCCDIFYCLLWSCSLAFTFSDISVIFLCKAILIY